MRVIVGPQTLGAPDSSSLMSPGRRLGTGGGVTPLLLVPELALLLESTAPNDMVLPREDPLVRVPT